MRARTSEGAIAQLPAEFLAGIGEQYVLERELGRGGMAIVWLARRRGKDEPVALKVLRPVLAEALASQRFLREMRIASSVKSPALVPLLDSGEVAGLPYYVMPFADGGSLRDRLSAEGHLRIADAVEITRRVAMALSALHTEGFVHRDIKPENVLLTAAGEASLADYGIARALTTAARDNFTSTGIVIGTAPYMSPEQGAGDQVDGRSDLYSLGCLLYEMLAGEPPFHGSTPQAVIARHMHEVPPSLRVVRGTVSEPLESVVMRMLAKVPADRFDTADEVIAALGSLGALQGTTAAWIRTRTTRRLRVGALAGGAVAVAVAAALYWSLRPVPLDPDRVVVFPFAAVGEVDPTLAQMPMLVGSALERAASTKWIDGHALLNATERASSSGINARRARSLARAEQARSYVDGTVSRVGDSTSVQVRLHDVSTGLLLDQKTETGSSASPLGDLVLRAMVRVLPKITGVDSVVDVSAMVGRNPAAVDNWLRGERAYRQSRMPEALRLLELAVAADSELSPAAFRAAAVSHWRGHPERAITLVQLALRHSDALSERQRRFAMTLERFLNGRADEAIVLLRPLLSRETETADAWMLAGEIFLHLLPTVAVDSQARTQIPAPKDWPLEAFAREAFETARRLDPGYSPPLPHLAEMAARRGDADEMARLYRLIGKENQDSIQALRMAGAERCLRVGAANFDWSAAWQRHPRTLFNVGFMLRGGTHPRARSCAAAAFAATLAADTAANSEDWLSLVALHGMLAAAGQTDRALRLVDSAMASGMPQAVGLFVLDAEAGIDVGGRADGFLGELLRNIGTRRAPSLWLLTLRAARAGDTAALARVHSALERRTRNVGERLDTLMTSVASAYLARERGDTLNALRRFAELRPTAVHSEVYGTLWESLAPERLAHTELLLAVGNATEAHRIATTFDHPEIVVGDLFLLRSLQLRERAASTMRDTTLASQARQRIIALRSSNR